MGNGYQSTSIRPRRRGRPRNSEPASLLGDLERRFAQFRAEHPQGARVPQDLRAAALAALRAGVAAGALYRACRISWKQLETWKAGQQGAIRARSRTRRAAPADVRVFSVVDAERSDRPAAEISTEHELELRLGRWSLRVRLAEPAQGE